MDIAQSLFKILCRAKNVEPKKSKYRVLLFTIVLQRLLSLMMGGIRKTRQRSLQLRVMEMCFGSMRNRRSNHNETP